MRAHHSLGDGVSFGNVLLDLSDEAEELRQKILDFLAHRRSKSRNRSLLQKLVKRLKQLVWFWLGSIRAIVYQLQLYWYSIRHDSPFDQLQQAAVNESGLPERSISWATVAPIDQVKYVAKTLLDDKKKVTLNDIFVSCVNSAITRQLQEHRRRWELLPGKRLVELEQ